MKPSPEPTTSVFFRRVFPVFSVSHTLRLSATTVPPHPVVRRRQLYWPGDPQYVTEEPRVRQFTPHNVGGGHAAQFVHRGVQ